jgi:hypothetical protein
MNMAGIQDIILLYAPSERIRAALTGNSYKVYVADTPHDVLARVANYNLFIVGEGPFSEITGRDIARQVRIRYSNVKIIAIGHNRLNWPAEVLDEFVGVTTSPYTSGKLEDEIIDSIRRLGKKEITFFLE